MALKGLIKIFDHQQSGSLSDRLRRKRFNIFKKMLEPLLRPISILDAGGTESFWERMGFTNDANYQITLLNLSSGISNLSSNLKSVAGDVRDMKIFKDKQFDVVFSNSVIEHVGEYSDQKRMAQEVLRVGKLYYVQTPNRYFPIEPHFLFPFFQFLPLKIKIWMIRHFDLGWHERAADFAEARELALSVRLLTKGELQNLFPDAVLEQERFGGMTKSFIVHSPVL